MLMALRDKCLLQVASHEFSMKAATSHYRAFGVLKAHFDFSMLLLGGSSDKQILNLSSN